MKRLVLACTLLLFCTGCLWRPVSTGASYFPKIPVPARPTLTVPATVKPGQSEDMDKMIDSLYLSTEHSKTLEELIRAYNETAAAHNENIRKSLGLE